MTYASKTLAHDPVLTYTTFTFTIRDMSTQKNVIIKLGMRGIDTNVMAMSVTSVFHKGYLA